MGKLIIDGNKVYSIDEACMKRKNLTLAQIRQMETGYQNQDREEKENRQRAN